jgi:branched-chain amino acid transport system substrate-binding protein
VPAVGDTVPVGLLFSTSGPYAALGREGLAGAMTAIREINETGLYGPLAVVARDPAGSTECYAPLAAELVAAGVRHIVGCTTSWSRKEVIPLLEKSGTMLWYPCPYEGFECNEQVIYLGACPNQHILPLLRYVLPRFGGEACLVGSNYIWGWETSRIARDIIEHSGGAVLSERFVPLGDTDIGRIVEEIRQKRPAFILNTLIGPSSYAFLKAYRALGRADPDFAPGKRPVLSCNLAESEAAALGEIAAGQIVIAPYFQSLDTDENRRFLAVAHRFAPEQQHLSAFFAQAYTAVHVLAASIARSGSDAPAEVRQAAMSVEHVGPLGSICLDGPTNHTILVPRIGRANAQGGFDIVSDGEGAIVPDPYLAHSALAVGDRSVGAPHLRVVK